MKIILILIAIILIAVGGWFIVQHLQSRRHTQPRLADANKTLKVKRAEPSIETPVQPNPLINVDAYLHNQDYTSAVSELKRILMTNPRHTGAMLKLLQVYGITKQYSAFNQLHQKIHQIADTKTVQEADFCKSLIDEELASLNRAKPEPVASTESEVETLSFDINNEEKNKQSSITQAKPQNFNQPEDSPELDFNLSFDDPLPTEKTAIKPLVAEPLAKDLSEDSLTLDFDFDQPKNTQAASFEETKNSVSDSSLLLDDDFSFDLDTPATTETKKSAQTTTNAPALDTSLNTDDGLDFVFDLEQPNPKSQQKPFDTTPKDIQPSLDTTNSKLSFDELSLTLDNDISKNHDISTQHPADFDSLSLSLEDTKSLSLEDTSTPLQSKNDDNSLQTSEKIDDFSALNLEDNKDSKSDEAPHREDGFDFEFALDFDNSQSEQTQDTPIAPAAKEQKTDLEFSFAEDPDFINQPIEFTQKSSEDLSRPEQNTNELSIDFSFDDSSIQTPIQPKKEHDLNAANAVKDFDTASNTDDHHDGIDFELPVIEVTPIRVEPVRTESVQEVAFETTPQNDDKHDALTLDLGFAPLDLDNDHQQKTQDDAGLAFSTHSDLSTTNQPADNKQPDVRIIEAQVIPQEIIIEPDSTQTHAAQTHVIEDSTHVIEDGISTPAHDVARSIEIPVEIIAQPIDKPEEASFDDLTNNNLSEAALEPEVTAFGTPSVALSDGFDLDTQDSWEITLTLAKQYLEFGEYDSAKRLLTEVIDQGNREQKNCAKDLIANLS